jgi:hypothetical protein
MDKIDTCMTLGVLTFIGVLVLLVVVLNLKCCDRRGRYESGYGYMRMGSPAAPVPLLSPGTYTPLGASDAIALMQSKTGSVVFVVLDDPPNHEKWAPIFTEVAQNFNVPFVGVSYLDRLLQGTGVMEFNKPYLMIQKDGTLMQWGTTSGHPYGVSGEPMDPYSIGVYIHRMGFIQKKPNYQ